ncbi:VOC family protein [Kitasatospora sp. NPDC096147]|uniref:VOC family protein n=1 Tax=Kitasatospora sp. NPDC096147 TaxID=3364093 RepID=UPI0037F42C95
MGCPARRHPCRRGRGWSHLNLPAGGRLAFQSAPEPRRAKSWLHLDMAVDDLPAAVAPATSLGATRSTVTDGQGFFRTMADPEGNEFCFVTGLIPLAR